MAAADPADDAPPPVESPLFCHVPALPPPVDVDLRTSPAHDCNYLPGRVAVTRAFWARHLSPTQYHAFMDAGFRRSGRAVYQPVCPHCRACIPIRIPVDRFAPSKSQRRRWRWNQDLIVTVGPALPTREKFDLYHHYQLHWHHTPDPHSPEEWVKFLYDSPVQTGEFCYRDSAGKLLGVGICDLSEGQSLSSVYFYFDPDHAHLGLGTFSVLYEIQYCRQQRIPYYYLGYWVHACTAMEYKATFRPCELLGPDGVWRESTQTP